MAKGSKKVRKISFEGVDKEIKKGGGGGKRIPEGDYVAKIIDGEFHRNEDTGASGIKWVFQIVEGKHKGVKLRGYTSLKPEALWSLRNLIHAATGKNVAGKAINLDIDKLIGKKVGIAVEDNEYSSGEGSKKKTKITSQVNTAFPADEVGGYDDEEEDDEETDEEEDDDEEDDDEEEDLEDVEVEDL